MYKVKFCICHIIEVILMFVMAEFSYQFIENPIRKKGFKAFTFNPKHVKRIVRTVLILVFLIPTLIAFTGVFDSLGKEHEAKQHSKRLLLILIIKAAETTAGSK